jgi:hypothetical protein
MWSKSVWCCWQAAQGFSGAYGVSEGTKCECWSFLPPWKSVCASCGSTRTKVDLKKSVFTA